MAKVSKTKIKRGVGRGAGGAGGGGSGGSGLSHVDAGGKAAMVDVSGKDVTVRVARARGEVHLSKAAADAIRENAIKKGDVFAVARIAGIQGAKRTDELIPLCHGLPVEHVEVAIEFLTRAGEKEQRIEIVTTARTTGKTGVEMEALTAVAVAGLTIIDMAKAIDKEMSIEGVTLIEKSGGRSGHFVNSKFGRAGLERGGK